MKTTKYPLLLVSMTSITLASCGGDDSNGSDSEQPAQLSVGVTDAPVDDAENVYVEFSGITLIQADDDDSEDDETDDSGDDDRVVITFDENQRIDLLAYQQGESYALIEGEDIPSGEYSQMRLMVETDQMNDTVIIFKDGTSHELTVPSGDQTGLKLVSGFTATAGGELDLILDFDLRKGIVETGNGGYKLKPTIRVIDNAEHGATSGSVAANLCEADDNLAVYVYEGSVAQPDDLGSDAEPLATGSVDLTDMTYRVSYLTPGNYTVALTCDANLDDPEADDDAFGSGRGFANISGELVVIDDETTEYHFQ